MIPVYCKYIEFPAEIVAYSFAYFNVKAGIFAVFTHIAEGGILGVNAHNKGSCLSFGCISRGTFGFLSLIAAAAKADAQHSHNGRN